MNRAWRKLHALIETLT